MAISKKNPRHVILKEAYLGLKRVTSLDQLFQRARYYSPENRKKMIEAMGHLDSLLRQGESLSAVEKEILLANAVNTIMAIVEDETLKG